MSKSLPLSATRWTVFALALLTADSMIANIARELDRRVITRIRGARRNEKIVLPNVILSDTETRTIELEEFSVYTPDATILVYDSDRPRRIAPPARRYFKGRVASDPTATVFFSVSTNSSEIDGLITIGEKKFAIAQGRRVRGQRIANAKGEAPILVAEIDPFAGGFEGPPFECATENVTMPAGQLPIRRKPIALAVTNTSYELRIAVETDNELYAAFGEPGAATDTLVNTYIGDLVAKASVIYMRDLNTKLNLGQVNIRPNDPSDPDPYVAVGSLYDGLQEFRNYWNANYSAVVRSAAVMVSGKWGGGLAFTGTLCTYGGAYALSGIYSGVELVIPSPNDTTADGIVYGLPVNNWWGLHSFAHELGHVVASPHTHCVGLTAAEKTLYSVTRNFVDECYSDSQTYGCFVGTPSVPPEKGTIMGYCYNMSRAGGYPESRYLFGEAGKPSEKILSILTDGLIQAVPDGFVTVGANLACAAGQVASVYDCGTGCTYSWAIAGGSIQGSTTTASISFTPNAGTVTLTATVTNALGCRIATSFATTSQCVTTLPAPTNLIATAASANSVNLSWTAVGGAASYEVRRSADGLVYITVGTPAGNAFTDSSAAADTSYLYTVGTRDAGMNTGPYGPPELATTVIFVDDPLTAQTTNIKAIHMTQLRTAVNAIHVLARLGTATFTDNIGALVPVRKIHIDELRSKLDASRSALGLVALVYTDTNISAASTTIQAAHFRELRDGVK